MTIKVNFKDYYKVKVSSDQNIETFTDFYTANASGEGKKLIIQMEATHSALPLNNPRYYIPSKMAEGVTTFRSGDQKPTKVLKHHKADSDPVGRVIGARYISTIPEDLVGNMDVMTLTSATADIKDQLASMRRLIRSGITQRDDWRGLGYIDLMTEISDEKAVKQLEDKLFDAVSTNFDSPGEIYCSICSQNLIKDGWCEHDRGEFYFADGLEEDNDMQFECQWIPGKHEYLEVSLVNLEGDPLASLEIVDTQNKDNNEVVTLSDSLKDSLSDTTFQFKDSVEEDDMKINGKEVSLSDAEQIVFDQIKKLRDEMKDEEVHALMLKVSKSMSSKKFIADKAEAEIDDETAVLYALETIENKDSELKAEEICTGVGKVLQEMKDKEELTEEAYTAASAKISEEGLGKLPKSAFVGPEMTFPVPDSALATATGRFVQSYDGPVNKVSLLAKISKKAKAFGTDSKEDSKVDEGEVEITSLKTEDIKNMDTEELRTLWHSVEVELIDRKQVLTKPCSDCAVKEAETTTAKKELGLLRDSAERTENIVSVLRDELKRAYVDFESQVDEYVKLGAELHSSKVEKVALVGVLTKKYDTLENAIEELKDSDISVKEKSFMDSFDISLAVEKINDGMGNVPSGESVDDPTATTDGDNKQFSDDLTQSAREAIINIKDCLKNGEHGTARQIHATMSKLGLFNQEITLESISAEMKTAE